MEGETNHSHHHRHPVVFFASSTSHSTTATTTRDETLTHNLLILVTRHQVWSHTQRHSFESSFLFAVLPILMSCRRQRTSPSNSSPDYERRSYDLHTDTRPPNTYMYSNRVWIVNRNVPFLPIHSSSWSPSSSGSRILLSSVAWVAHARE